MPGPGNSSPIVARGRVFITCAEEQGKKRNLYSLDRKTGSEIWKRTVEFAGSEPTHNTNPYCGSTPVTDAERIVVWHGSAGIFCYDYEGKELWNSDPGDVRHDWGYGSSPIIHRGKVILNFGPGPETFLTALDLKTGKILWKHDEPGGLEKTTDRMVGSWATPTVVTVNGIEQILCSLPTRVVALDPETGAGLWSVSGLSDGKYDMVTPSTEICGDVAVAFAGWINGPAMGFRLGGSGDVTEANRLWRDKQTQRMGTGVAVDGRIYVVNSGPGTAQCIDCATGKVLWTERLEGGESWGSVVMAAGRFYVTSRRGVTSVFRANPKEFKLLAANDLKEQSHATPAISGGEIFIRTHHSLYCIAEQIAMRQNQSP